MFNPKNPKRPNHQSANMAHFVTFCIGFQKNIPLQNPPGGGGYMAAQIYMKFHCNLWYNHKINILRLSNCLKWQNMEILP